MAHFKTEIKNFLNNTGEKISEDKLIKFDYKVILLLISSVLLFFLLVFFKIHGSSIPIWNNLLFSEETERSLLLGTPKNIRSDEWCIYTPFILSQETKGFPAVNESLGAGKTPLILNLPVYHYTLLFRPQYWGFLVFQKERAFSFFWNFKTTGLFISFFLLLMLLTKNNFSLSLSGSLWLYLSGYIQWFFSTSMSDMITAFFLMFVSLVYLLYSKKKIFIFFSFIFFIIFFLSFSLWIYPPYQIPLFYLFIFLTGGYFFRRYDDFFKNEKFFLRIVYLLLAIIISSIILYCFYLEIEDTFKIMAHTIYPGNRISFGGEITVYKCFSGFYDVFYGEKNFPAGWLNVCEASNFILLYPVILFIILRNLLLYRKNYFVLEVFLLIYILFLTLWILVGFPPLIAKLSLLSRVPSNRALLALGIANIILVITFLSNDNISDKYSYLEKFIFWSVLFFSFILHGAGLRKVHSFFQIWHIAAVSILFAGIIYFLIKRKNFYFFFLLYIFLLPNFLVNPISLGLKPIFDKKLSRTVTEIAKRDPDAGWMVFGNWVFSNFIKASGINVTGGVNFVPDLEKMKILDPEEKNIKVYNRYANISIHNKKYGEGDVEFELTDPTNYIISAKPSAEKFKNLDIKYFVFMPQEFSCEDLLYFYPLAYIAEDSIWICQYNSINNAAEAYIRFKSMESGKSPEIIPPDLIFSDEPVDDLTDFSIDVLNDIVVCGEKEPPFLTFKEDMIFVRGWATDRLACDISGSVYIDIDGKAYPAYYGLDRPDVAEAYNRPSYKYSGFEALISALQAGKGKHCLSIKILSKDGKYFYSPEKKIFFEFR